MLECSMTELVMACGLSSSGLCWGGWILTEESRVCQRDAEQRIPWSTAAVLSHWDSLQGKTWKKFLLHTECWGCNCSHKWGKTPSSTLPILFLLSHVAPIKSSTQNRALKMKLRIQNEAVITAVTFTQLLSSPINSSLEKDLVISNSQATWYKIKFFALPWQKEIQKPLL